jgi:hypothetical protein
MTLIHCTRCGREESDARANWQVLPSDRRRVICPACLAREERRAIPDARTAAGNIERNRPRRSPQALRPLASVMRRLTEVSAAVARIVTSAAKTHVHEPARGPGRASTSPHCQPARRATTEESW